MNFLDEANSRKPRPSSAPKEAAFAVHCQMKQTKHSTLKLPDARPGEPVEHGRLFPESESEGKEQSRLTLAWPISLVSIS